MTVRASLLKQQTDFINGALRHAVSRHDLFTSSLKQDQYNYKLQAQRGGLRNDLYRSRNHLLVFILTLLIFIASLSLLYFAGKMGQRRNYSEQQVG